MTEKSLQIMDQSQGNEDFGPEIFIMMVANFEKSTFDIKMRQMLDGLIEKDWAKVMVAAHTMKGSCGYIYAQRFMDVCKTFQEFIKNDCERLEYSVNDVGDINRPYYKVLASFDIAKKLKGYEYFFPFMEEAKVLKREMSKVSKSVYSLDLYDKDIQLIRQHYDEMRTNGTLLVKQLTLPQQQQYQSNRQIATIVMEEKPMPLAKQKTQEFEPPQQAKCCEKCSLF